jgi:ethanolaminephosphotransferase
MTRRWNQTGQKFAGAPDIARTFFASHTHVLWVAAFATYADVVRRATARWPLQFGGRSSSSYATASSSIVVFLLAAAAFVFKCAYTSAEAPELMPAFLAPLLKAAAPVSLLVQARVVFLGTLLALSHSCMVEFRAGAGGQEKMDGAGELFFLVGQRFIYNSPWEWVLLLT